MGSEGEWTVCGVGAEGRSGCSAELSGPAWDATGVPGREKGWHRAGRRGMGRCAGEREGKKARAGPRVGGGRKGPPSGPKPGREGRRGWANS